MAVFRKQIPNADSYSLLELLKQCDGLSAAANKRMGKAMSAAFRDILQLAEKATNRGESDSELEPET